jgi:hypothetical protein
MKFKVGDRVKTHNCESGVIVGIDEAGSYLVEIENKTNGHNGEGFELISGNRGKDGACWWYSGSRLILKPDNKPEINEVLYGTKTTIIKWFDGTQTQAICSKNDEFDKQVGFAIAYTRKMNGGKLHE